MTAGISTFDLGDTDFTIQLNSLLNRNVEPDFILLHYAGRVNSGWRYYRFLKKTIKQYRFKSLSFIFNKYRKTHSTIGAKALLNEDERIRLAAFLQKVKVIKVKGINDKSTIEKIRRLKSAVIVSNSGILKENVLNLPGIIFLNIHASRLPSFRGMNNIEWALWEGSEIYVTVHKISRGIDEGDILYQEKIGLSSVELNRIEEYREYCFHKSNAIIGDVVHKFLQNEIDFVEQDQKGLAILQYYVMHPILKTRLEKRLMSS